MSNSHKIFTTGIGCSSATIRMGGRPRPQNRLLGELLSQGGKHLRHGIERVFLPSRKVLFEPDGPMGWMYFPECSVVAITHEFEDGTIMQSAAVGSEGVVPVRALLRSELVRSRHIVQVPGFAMRIKASMLLGAVEDSPPCRRIVATHIEAFLSRLLQSVACNALHSVEERCACWLLMISHSTGSHSFPLTHDSLAELLGVHRPTVTVAICALREAGLIGCGRGEIEIIDQRGLEHASCACYGAIRQAEDE